MRTMDCADCYIVKVDKILDSGVNVSNYGSIEDTKILKKCGKVNGVHCLQAHEKTAFGLHAAGIHADFYVKDTLRNNLGPPPPILNYILSCDSDQSKALGSGYNVS